jgi:thiamine-monophosphate kinase
MTTVREVGEWGLIEAIAKVVGPAATHEIGIGDDTAVGQLTPGFQALTTLDMLVEDVHFRRTTTSARDLGYKALAVNLSDIAAMGGLPRWAVIGLALPPELEVAWVLELYAGMRELGHVQLVGGDVVRSPGGVTISLALVGEVEKPLTRSAARPGDKVFMTGPAGLAAAGLWCLEHPHAPVEAAWREAAEAAQRRPTPQLEAGRALVGLGARVALMDNSDGLGRSALAIAAASGVDLRLYPEAFPCETATRGVAALAGIDPAKWILEGGEDYGLVGCISPAGWPALTNVVAAVEVGEVVTGSGRAWVQGPMGNFDALDPAGGYRHFT